MIKDCWFKRANSLMTVCILFTGREMCGLGGKQIQNVYFSVAKGLMFGISEHKKK